MNDLVSVDNYNVVFEKFFMISLDLLSLIDTKGTFIKVNKEWKNIIGYSIEELEGRQLIEFIHPDDIEITVNAMLVLNKQNQVLNFTNRYKCKDASYRYIEWRLQLYDNMIYSCARDISEKENFKIEIEKQKKVVNSIIDAIPDAIFIKDRESRYISCNKAFAEKMIKSSSEEVLGKTDYDFFHDLAQANQNRVQDKEIMGSQKKHINYATVKTSEGYIEFETIKTPFYDENDKVIGIIGIARDISIRKYMEEKLLVSEEKFRLLFENMTNCFSLHEVIVDDKGEAVDFSYTMINKAYEIQMNQKYEDVVGKTMLEINPLADKEMIQKYCEVGLTGKPLHLEYFSKTFNKYFSVVAYSSQKGLFATVFEDITKKREMEEEIKKIGERLRLATKAANVGIWEYSITKNTLEWDEGMYKLYGIEEKAGLGAYEAWKNGMHKDDLEKYRKHLHESIRGNRDFNPEFRVVWKDGSIHYIKANSVILQDEHGNPFKVIGTNWDVTEHNHYEIALIKAKEEAQAASIAKSQFLANMSHEIRTPMNGIMGMSDLLLYSDLTNDQKQMVNIVKSSSKALLQIINDILDLSKIEAGKVELVPEYTNIQSFIDNDMKMYRVLTNNKKLILIIDVEKDVPREIFVDAMRLSQIITNIIGNAIKFTQKGEIQLVVKKIKSIETKVQLMFSIKDSGIGIKKEDIPKLFNYFSQIDDSKTKQFQGTGLGLAISKRLVELMNGEICVESEFGKGSTFYFTIWVEEMNKKNVIESLPFISPSVQSKSNINLLIVEDDHVSQLIIDRMCKMYKWDIYIASNSKEALKILKNTQFNIILMDIQLPEMSGIEIVKIIREREKTTGGHIPIIATTAYAMDQNKIDIIAAGIDDYISKPFNLIKLKELIESFIK